LIDPLLSRPSSGALPRGGPDSLFYALPPYYKRFERHCLMPTKGRPGPFWHLLSEVPMPFHRCYYTVIRKASDPKRAPSPLRRRPPSATARNEVLSRIRRNSPISSASPIAWHGSCCAIPGESERHRPVVSGRTRAGSGVYHMGRRKTENDLSRSVRKMLLVSRDKDTIEARRQRIERLRLTEWRIWKVLGISWT